MTTAGPNYSGSCTDSTGAGATNWANPSNAAGSTNFGGHAASAHCVIDKTTSHDLVFTGFGFSIPPGATILGIAAEIQCANTSSVNFQVAQFLKGGSAAGTNLVTPNATAFASTTLGGSSNLGGTTWTSSDINSSGFGLTVSAIGNANGNDADVYGVRITVTYSAGGGPGGPGRPPRPGGIGAATSFGFMQMLLGR